MRSATAALPRAGATDQHGAGAGRGRHAAEGDAGRVSAVTDETLREYFGEAASWDADRAAQLRRSAQRAWQVAAAACLCALAMAACLALLLPLKRVEPFVVRVDSSTGIVDVVPVYNGSAGLEQTVTRYFLTHYVSVCERFNFATAESDYEECGAFHGAQRNQAWYALWNPTNPASPLNVHKDGSTVTVQIAAVSFFQRGSGVTDLAQVRYLKAERQGGDGAAARISHWIATIQYAYASPPRDPRVRRWNPLGFKVVELTTEPEVIAPAAADTTR
jgi:type IV secretion system protein VirB8